MDLKDEVEFLILIRDKVDLLIPQISLNDPLIEISGMLTAQIRKLSPPPVEEKV